MGAVKKHLSREGKQLPQQVLGRIVVSIFRLSR